MIKRLVCFLVGENFGKKSTPKEEETKTKKIKETKKQKKKKKNGFA